MHEFSTMQMTIETVLTAAKAHKAEKIIEINLEIGELTFLNPEQLKFAFSVLSKNTIAEDAKLNIKQVQLAVKCTDCGYEGPIKYNGPTPHLLSVPLYMKCINCGSSEVNITAGRECNIRNFKVKVPNKA
jgi:hydrogenase nickel incorporation protein HypA/HybF